MNDSQKKIVGTILMNFNPSAVVTEEMIEKMVDEMTSIITLICGEDATDEEIEVITNTIADKYGDIELDVVKGKQPVYSFIVGIE